MDRSWNGEQIKYFFHLVRKVDNKLSWTFCNTRTIKKTKKPHKCEYCRRIIPEGSINIFHWSGVFNGNFQNSYVCHWCESNDDNLFNDYDNEILDFWDCLREYVFQEQFRKYKNCDCIDEKGFTGNIEVYLEGDYLIFRCEDCGREWHREYMPVVNK